jgi:hypothetical protein
MSKQPSGADAGSPTESLAVLADDSAPSSDGGGSPKEPATRAAAHRRTWLNGWQRLWLLATAITYVFIVVGYPIKVQSEKPADWWTPGQFLEAVGVLALMSAPVVLVAAGLVYFIAGVHRSARDPLGPSGRVSALASIGRRGPARRRFGTCAPLCG